MKETVELFADIFVSGNRGTAFTLEQTSVPSLEAGTDRTLHDCTLRELEASLGKLRCKSASEVQTEFQTRHFEICRSLPNCC